GAALHRIRLQERYRFELGLGIDAPPPENAQYRVPVFLDLEAIFIVFDRWKVIFVDEKLPLLAMQRSDGVFPLIENDRLSLGGKGLHGAAKKIDGNATAVDFGLTGRRKQDGEQRD